MEASVWSTVQRSMVGRSLSPRADPALQTGAYGFAAALRLVSEEYDSKVAQLSGEIVRLQGILRNEYGAVIDDTPRVPASSRGFGSPSPRGLRLEMLGPRGGLRAETATPLSPRTNAPSRVSSPASGTPASPQRVSPKAGPRAVPRPPPLTPCCPTDGHDNGDGFGDESALARSKSFDEATSDASRYNEFRSEVDGRQGMRPLASVRNIVECMKSETSLRSWAPEAVNRNRSNVRVECFFGIVILLNTLLLGVSIDVYPDWLGWLVIDGAFATIFLAEMLVKIRRHGLFQFFFRADRIQNCFELFVVVTALVDFALSLITVLALDVSQRLVSLLRLLRLFRVFRVMRVWRLDFFGELIAMIRGTLGGARTLLWAVVLICVPVYAMSIFLRETIVSQGQDKLLEVRTYFGSVPGAFFFVFRCSVLQECADSNGRPIFVLLEQEHGWIFGALWCVMGVFMSFGLFNVIVAMFVENVVKASKAKELQIRKDRLRDTQFFAHKISELLVVIVDHTKGRNDRLIALPHASSSKSSASLEDVFAAAADLRLDKATFESVWHDSRAMAILDDLDIAEQDRSNMFDVLDCDGSGSIDIDELCEGILKLRGGMCRSDIVGISFLVQDARSEIRTYLSSIMRHLTEQQDALEKHLDINFNRSPTNSRATSKGSV